MKADLIDSWHARLAEAIRAKSWQDKEFAEMAGVSPAAIHKWTTGKTKKFLKEPYLSRVCELLSIDKDWLEHGDGDYEAIDQAQAIKNDNKTDVAKKSHEEMRNSIAVTDEEARHIFTLRSLAQHEKGAVMSLAISLASEAK